MKPLPVCHKIWCSIVFPLIRTGGWLVIMEFNGSPSITRCSKHLWTYSPQFHFQRDGSLMKFTRRVRSRPFSRKRSLFSRTPLRKRPQLQPPRSSFARSRQVPIWNHGVGLHWLVRHTEGTNFPFGRSSQDTKCFDLWRWGGGLLEISHCTEIVPCLQNAPLRVGQEMTNRQKADDLA
jgi:hypothetical protein